MHFCARLCAVPCRAVRYGRFFTVSHNPALHRTYCIACTVVSAQDQHTAICTTTNATAPVHFTIAAAARPNIARTRQSLRFFLLRFYHWVRFVDACTTRLTARSRLAFHSDPHDFHQTPSHFPPQQVGFVPYMPMARSTRKPFEGEASCRNSSFSDSLHSVSPRSW